MTVTTPLILVYVVGIFLSYVVCRTFNIFDCVPDESRPLEDRGPGAPIIAVFWPIVVVGATVYWTTFIIFYPLRKLSDRARKDLNQ